MDVFQPEHNRMVDMNPSCSLPSLPLSSAFIKSYLNNRIPPPFRPTPLTPYTPFDIIVFDNLLTRHTSESVLLQMSLFPTIETEKTINVRNIDNITVTVTRLVTRLSNSFKQSNLNFQSISIILYKLHSVVSQIPDIIISALSPRNDKRVAIDRIREWSKVCRSSSHNASSINNRAYSLNGMSWDACSDSICASLINALLNIPGPERLNNNGCRIQLGKIGNSINDLNCSDSAEVRDILLQVPEITGAIARLSLKECNNDTNLTVEKLKQGWRPDVIVGKRGGGKRKRNTAKSINKLNSFGDGDNVDTEWIKRHVEQEHAREQMEQEQEEKEEEKNHIINLNLESITDNFDNIYDDEPDEGVLEGEVSLIGLHGDDDEEENEDNEIRLSSSNNGRGGSKGSRGGSNSMRANDTRRGRGRGSDRTFPKGSGRGRGGTSTGTSSNSFLSQSSNLKNSGGRGGSNFSRSFRNSTGNSVRSDELSSAESGNSVNSQQDSGDVRGGRGGGRGGRGGRGRGRGRGRGGDRGRGQNRKARAIHKQNSGM